MTTEIKLLDNQLTIKLLEQQQKPYRT